MSIPGPGGLPDKIVGWTLELLQSRGFATKQTRRGAIRLKLHIKDSHREQALKAHLDTLEALVQPLKILVDVICFCRNLFNLICTGC